MGQKPQKSDFLYIKLISSSLKLTQTQKGVRRFLSRERGKAVGVKDQFFLTLALRRSSEPRACP
jgi:hypothetical protein